MKTSAVIALLLSIVGAILCAGVAIHEWNYHEDHPFATGVSGVLVVLALGAMLGCVAVAVFVYGQRR